MEQIPLHRLKEGEPAAEKVWWLNGWNYIKRKRQKEVRDKGRGVDRRQGRSWMQPLSGLMVDCYKNVNISSDAATASIQLEVFPETAAPWARVCVLLKGLCKSSVVISPKNKRWKKKKTVIRSCRDLLVEVCSFLSHHVWLWWGFSPGLVLREHLVRKCQKHFRIKTKLISP